MLDYLRTETFALREANSELCDEIAETDQDKRELWSHVESAEAAAASSRLQIAQLTKANAQLANEVSEYRERGKKKWCKPKGNGKEFACSGRVKSEILQSGVVVGNHVESRRDKVRQVTQHIIKSQRRRLNVHETNGPFSWQYIFSRRVIACSAG